MIFFHTLTSFIQQPFVYFSHVHTQSLLINNRMKFPFPYLPRDYFNSQLVRWIVGSLDRCSNFSWSLSSNFWSLLLQRITRYIWKSKFPMFPATIRYDSLITTFISWRIRERRSYRSIVSWIDRSNNEANNRTFRRDSRAGERVKRKRNYASGAR